MIAYSEDTWAEIALQVLEHDVRYVASKYHIPGYTRDDLEQELRMRLWQKVHLYNPRKSGIRAWANAVMRNHLRNLVKKAFRDKRKSDFKPVFIGESDVFDGNCLNIEEIIDIVIENHLDIEDFV